MEQGLTLLCKHAWLNVENIQWHNYTHSMYVHTQWGFSISKKRQMNLVMQLKHLKAFYHMLSQLSPYVYLFWASQPHCWILSHLTEIHICYFTLHSPFVFLFHHLIFPWELFTEMKEHLAHMFLLQACIFQWPWHRMQVRHYNWQRRVWWWYSVTHLYTHIHTQTLGRSNYYSATGIFHSPILPVSGVASIVWTSQRQQRMCFNEDDHHRICFPLMSGSCIWGILNLCSLSIKGLLSLVL